MPQRLVIVAHRTQPGARAQVQAVWQRHMPAAITDNPEHLLYVYGLDPHDEDVIRACQVYSDASAATAFSRSAAYLAYVEAVAPLLLGPPLVKVADVAWVKG